MIRLLGFLVGSAIAVATILLLLGVPDLRVAEPEAVPMIVADSTPAPDPTDAPDPTVAPKPTDDPTVEIVQLPDEIKWYSFWSPFRSEIAAGGFISQLEAVTGFDYRVVKIRTGVYEVTFAYADDIERRSKLSRIASATGLELPDS